MYKISDFKVGQTAYIELTGNAIRGIKCNSEEAIRECIIESVGRKYVTAYGSKFEEHNFSYGGLKEHTDMCVNYVLYPCKQDILDKFEKENIIDECKNVFGGLIKCKADSFSLEKLRAIKKIIDG